MKTYFSLSELRPQDRDLLRLLANFYTEEQVDNLPNDLSSQYETALSASSVRRNANELFEQLVDDRMDEFDVFTRQLGLNLEIVGDKQRREILGALYWVEKASRLQQAVEIPKDLVERLGLPVIILDHNLASKDGWRWSDRHDRSGNSGVVCPVLEDSSLFEGECGDQRRQFVDRVWERVQQIQPNAYDTPTLYRVKRHFCLRGSWDSRGSSGTRLELERTNYRHFKGTNDAFQVEPQGDGSQRRGRFANEAWGLELGHAEMRNLFDLPGSLLANPLSVTTTLITKDPNSNSELMAIAHRNVSQVGSGKYRFNATSGGFCSTAGNKNDMVDGMVDVFRTARREFDEEIGTIVGDVSAVTEQQVLLSGLVRDAASCFEVGLVGEIHVPFEVLHLLTPGVDSSFELQDARLDWVRLNPSDFAEWLLKNGGPRGFLPFGYTSAIFSLLRRFAVQQVEMALRPVLADKTLLHRRMTARLGHPVPDLLQP